ncbi:MULTISPECIES: HEPN domain-containing protein [Rhizobium/Agrobacterium group]|uniref:HEPN domain-containing protein n=1 Tax=Rhizobium/Agrobacterium group TaxID=227290 RepID=UPI00107F6E31|nr:MULTISPECIES: HEPN domain-containing protein [Rhizobium/Agrobacterium group]MBB4399711.1 hypothetical protein [Agrobacterium radiobacter]MBB5585866.1 hypothetical protein [Agrobacterium radiobacter]
MLRTFFPRCHNLSFVLIPFSPKENAAIVGYVALSKGTTMPEHSTIFLERGRIHLQAADLVIASGTGTHEFFDPLATLLLFSTEICLKAVIVHKTGKIPFKHDIDNFLESAVEQGLQVSNELAAGIFMVATPYKQHAPRYAPHHEKIQAMPPISIMREIAEQTYNRCRALIRGDSSPLGFRSLSLDEVRELRRRVTDAYQTQISTFDPTKVYSAEDAPPIPPGTITLTPKKKP